jgi:hypothetical protein
MIFRRVASIDGAIVTAAGILRVGWGPMFLRCFGDLMPAGSGAYSLIRLAGVGFLLAGWLLLAVRYVPDAGLQRRIAMALMSAHILVGFIG